jgi:hypothetical protein
MYQSVPPVISNCVNNSFHTTIKCKSDAVKILIQMSKHENCLATDSPNILAKIVRSLHAMRQVSSCSDRLPELLNNDFAPINYSFLPVSYTTKCVRYNVQVTQLHHMQRGLFYK